MARNTTEARTLNNSLPFTTADADLLQLNDVLGRVVQHNQSFRMCVHMNIHDATGLSTE